MMTTIDEVEPVIKAAYTVTPAKRYVTPALSENNVTHRF